MRRIIIDCDPGNGIPGANVDDGLAIALALAAKEISLELITIVAGNTPRETGYCVAKQLMAQLSLDIPVVKGAAQALSEPAAPWREHLDNSVKKQGLLGLWQNVPEVAVSPSAEAPTAAQAIGELVCNNPGEITVVAIGPLTNIAQVIQLYPDFAKSVAEISIMGGVFNLDTYLKDTNFAIDPEAAQIVLNSGANITLAPLDVTTTTLFTHADLDKIAEIDSPLCQYLVETVRPWLDYSIATRKINGCWIHDVLCVAQLIAPDIVTGDKYIVDVALEGDYIRGSSRKWKKDTVRLKVGMPEMTQQPITVLESVDNERLLALIIKALNESK